MTRPLQCLTLSLFVVPPLLLAAYFFAAFPSPPEPLYIHASLASLPPTAKSWSIYPEDFYPGGEYVTFPHGRVGIAFFLNMQFRLKLVALGLIRCDIGCWGLRKGGRCVLRDLT